MDFPTQKTANSIDNLSSKRYVSAFLKKAPMNVITGEKLAVSGRILELRIN
jgi:hypothetical protein